MPDALKSILVDDWEKITKERKLPPVPSPAPVTKFLNEYETFEMGQRMPGSADADILEEVIAGVKEYFNKALGRILLYKVERQQFYEIHRELEKGHGEYAGKTLCDVYGCEHLLRLFGKSSWPFSLRSSDMKQCPCLISSVTPIWTCRLSLGCARRSLKCSAGSRYALRSTSRQNISGSATNILMSRQPHSRIMSS